jgi:hypothetical protein
MKNLLLAAAFLGLSVYLSDISLLLQISLFSIGAGLLVLNLIGIDF